MLGYKKSERKNGVGEIGQRSCPIFSPVHRENEYSEANGLGRKCSFVAESIEK